MRTHTHINIRNCKVEFAKYTFFKKNCKKICIYQKKAVPLHREIKKA